MLLETIESGSFWSYLFSGCITKGSAMVSIENLKTINLHTFLTFINFYFLFENGKVSPAWKTFFQEADSNNREEMS